jgi:hypothetical protein
MDKTVFIFLTAMTTFGLRNLALAEPYSIYEIQYTEDPGGSSPLQGQVIDCLGGIVTHKYGGLRPKLTIQDPNFLLGWGAIQVKDWLTGAPLFNRASVGDWVTLTNVYVEEYRGNTILQCWSTNNPDLAVISSDNPLPEPLLIDVNEIAAPVYEDVNYGWFVANHNAEKYEHMRLRVENVIITEMWKGKANDNYVLEDTSDPNFSCWAADYMNEDAELYHPYVYTGRQFCSVEGILEQYTRINYGWDYYQLLTTSTDSFAKADLDGDCDFDLRDFSVFAQYWLTEEQCATPDWCSGADRTEDDFVDTFDLMEFSQHWLEGK